MTEQEQYGKLVDELEDRADALDDQNQRLGDRIAVARQDAESARAESGATPDWDDPDDDDHDEDEDGDSADDEEDEEDD